VLYGPLTSSNHQLADHTQSSFLLNFNVRDHYPAASTPQVMTPGAFVSLAQQAIYHLGNKI
jgi:hypothetical protein